jgi:predicted O-methyltransferase YrrM
MAETRICEIGFNAGHSAMLMLLGRNPNPIDFTIFDIGHHSYSKPCLEYIKNYFPHVHFELIEGDSTVEMPIWIEKHPELVEQYDIVHVDGGHNEHCIRNDMLNAVKLVKINGIIIIDDTNDSIINHYVDHYLQQDNFEEINSIHKTYGYPHRMIRRIL